jgi:NAD(P)-dependent dehydrogenase (short-subunit alcohol dehydrogenase family)
VIFELSGRTALVTGAGQHVGAGIAAMLAAQGAAVAVNDVVPDRAEATAEAIRSAGGRSVEAPFDVTDYAQVVAGVRDAVAALGPVDILVNNAGNGGAHGMTPTQFRDLEPGAWEGPVQVNLYGVLHCCHAVVDGMCDRGWGRIITISSGAGTHGINIGVAPYSAGKGGGIAFMRSLAMEVARLGVTANTLAIGLQTMEDAAATEHLARAVPVGRTGIPEDVGAACVWLASDEAEWVTGQTIAINGGSITT